MYAGLCLFSPEKMHTHTLHIGPIHQTRLFCPDTFSFDLVICFTSGCSVCVHFGWCSVWLLPRIILYYPLHADRNLSTDRSLEQFIQRFFSNPLLSTCSVLDLQPWCLSHLLPHNSGSPSPKVSFSQSLLKCCTQYDIKFGKLSCGHRTGKGQFSFQPHRKAMPKNVQTTAQLHSSHTLAK